MPQFDINDPSINPIGPELELLSLFQFAKCVVISSGGDGTVAIISRQYEELARRFSKYEHERGLYFLNEDNKAKDKGIIVFRPNPDSQEAIIFTRDVGFRELSGYDVTIIVQDMGNL